MPAARTHESRTEEVPRSLRRAAGWSWRLLVFGAAVYFLLRLLARLSVVVLPLIIALILATLCVPPARWLHRRGVPDGLAAALVVVGGLAGIIGILVALAPSFAQQISELQPTIEQGVDNILTELEQLGYDQQRINDLLQQARSRLASSSSSILSSVAGGIAAVVSGLAGLALLLVLLFFFVKDASDITGWMLSRTPAHRRELATALGGRAWHALSGYVRGTAAIAAIDAIGVGVGLAIIGVPLVMPLALLVFLGAFLPVIGALLAGLVAVLVGFAAGGLGMGLAVLALIIVVQQIEGNVLQPMIMRRAVALHPIVVLTALAVGATLAGIVGAFLSLPIAAVLAAVGNELRLRSEARHRDDVGLDRDHSGAVGDAHGE